MEQSRAEEGPLFFFPVNPLRTTTDVHFWEIEQRSDKRMKKGREGKERQTSLDFVFVLTIELEKRNLASFHSFLEAPCLVLSVSLQRGRERERETPKCCQRFRTWVGGGTCRDVETGSAN